MARAVAVGAQEMHAIVAIHLLPRIAGTGEIVIVLSQVEVVIIVDLGGVVMRVFPSYLIGPVIAIGAVAADNAAAAAAAVCCCGAATELATELATVLTDAATEPTATLRCMRATVLTVLPTTPSNTAAAPADALLHAVAVEGLIVLGRLALEGCA